MHDLLILALFSYWWNKKWNELIAEYMLSNLYFSIKQLSANEGE